MFSHGHKTDRIYDGMSVSYAAVMVDRQVNELENETCTKGDDLTMVSQELLSRCVSDVMTWAWKYDMTDGHTEQDPRIREVS